ncbi:hypothetical protein BOTBODRAFT_155106 [Botryobasidium botryosum FD-172 SS1]|uniref:Zn(2)-C6 fungal-type domain-containing protein n=1 Tax=Botryobasidium botryosum (strain FD-172 SS1) TaxID=930990 RepID=A0A067MTL9_BOTB1|nr:hypothetical protein BOTBODRAFT_155106 [Botryobasidium botryosum FD-172 SS1]
MHPQYPPHMNGGSPSPGAPGARQPAYYPPHPPSPGYPHAAIPMPPQQPGGRGAPVTHYVYPAVPAYPYAHPYAHYQQVPPPPPHHRPPPPPQYAQSPQPQPSRQRTMSSPSSTPATPMGSQQGNKRKRKSTDTGKSRSGDRGSEDEASGSEAPAIHSSASASTPVQAPSPAVDKNKRTKTQRACDPCRRKKIRRVACDVIPESEPPICQHCKQYGFECTFFLPITETRFKKKREEEAAAAAALAQAAAAEKPGAPSNGERARSNSARAESSETPDVPKGEVKIYGPTSLSYIMHSTPSVPTRAFESYDLRYRQTWEVGKSGDGFIQIHEPSPSSAPLTMPKPVETRMERGVMEKLVNSYFKNIAPLFPVVTAAEFLASPSPPPVLLYAICCVAAAARDVPQRVFEALRAATNAVIRSEDVLSNASVVNVQALLILGMCGDCHSTSVHNAMSAAWLRVSAAIRMAQDLGLHRAEAVKTDIDLRRRLWAACVVSDRWYGLIFGHPFMIDVHDCDVRLPTPEDPATEETRLTQPCLFLGELVKLSILLGRVLKAIYSPTGLVHATDEVIQKLLDDMDSWKANLPPALVYRGPDSIQPAGLLHLFYSCVCMIFWRVFMRITYACPAHLKFSLTVERMSELLNLARESIEWLVKHEHLYDMWLIIAYATTSAALVEYHTHARRRDPDSLISLQSLRDCVQRWEAAIEPGHMSSRRKTSEIISLLFEASQSHNAPEPATLNPTVGVNLRSFQNGNYQFRKDPSRPGGGIWVASEQIVQSHKDVPKGTFLLQTELEDEEKGKGESNSRQKTDVEMAPPAGEEGSKPGEASGILNIAPLGQGLINGSGMVDHDGASGEIGSGGMPLSANVNPSIAEARMQPGVQVLNTLDQPTSSVMFGQFAGAEHGLLDGIPGSMFDWDQWETFFTRLNLPTDPNALSAFQAAAAAGMPAPSMDSNSGAGSRSASGASSAQPSGSQQPGQISRRESFPPPQPPQHHSPAPPPPQ